MFSVLIGNFKMYGMIALGVIVAGFLAMFKYRGMKIQGLEGKLKEADKHIKVAVEKQRRAKTSRKVEKDIAKVIKESELEKDSVPKDIKDLMDKSTIEKVSSGL